MFLQTVPCDDSYYFIDMKRVHNRLQIQKNSSNDYTWGVNGLINSQLEVTDHSTKRSNKVVEFSGSVTKYDICVLHGPVCSGNHDYLLCYECD